MSYSKKILLIFSGVLFTLFVIVFWTKVRPSIVELVAVSGRESSMSEVENLMLELGSVRKELKKTENHFVFFADEFNVRETLFSFLNAQKSELKFEIVEMIHFGIMGGEKHKMNVLRLKLKGNFNDLIRVLGRLEEIEKGIRVGACSIANEKNTYTRENELVLSVFIQAWITQ